MSQLKAGEAVVVDQLQEGSGLRWALPVIHDDHVSVRELVLSTIPSLPELEDLRLVQELHHENPVYDRNPRKPRADLDQAQP